ncbi:hypothetical protein BKA66DRAFT_73368 [Pyrenochaeta sp. MPI-SDFR-AT-0127]|nr:hypothetical protein BKA66DRAFT_73368 [Pyrenochaeta sp. MPI-SDFR-AT-0127]
MKLRSRVWLFSLIESAGSSLTPILCPVRAARSVSLCWMRKMLHHRDLNTRGVGGLRMYTCIQSRLVDWVVVFVHKTGGVNARNEHQNLQSRILIDEVFSTFCY